MATGGQSIRSGYQSWVNFDFTALQKELDVTATELADRQDKSEISRKKLVELSREFKKNASEEVMKSVIPLLKSFQGEIDALSKRSKLSETAFLSVYKKLINLPDPVPLLNLALEETTSAAIPCSSKESIPDEKVEESFIKESSTAHDITEPFRKYDAINLIVEKKTNKIDNKLENGLTEKKRHLHDSYVLLEKRLHDAEDHVNAIKTALDSTKSELVKMNTKYEAASVEVDKAADKIRDRRDEVCKSDAILEMIEEKLKDRHDYNEIRSAIINAVSFCYATKDTTMKCPSSSMPMLFHNKRLSSSSSSSADDDHHLNEELNYTISLSRHRTHGDTSLASEYSSHCLTDSVCSASEPACCVQQKTKRQNHKAKSHHGSTAATENFCHFNGYNTSKLLSSRSPIKSPDKLTSGQNMLDLVPEIVTIPQKPTKTDDLGAIHSLSTTDVAQHIREILSTHNIGQRLFARHVLGLSQGTVSELLSKPKHWDKLTEKGRESYRRMHLWASDDANIMTLKAYAPKKGSGIVLSNYEQDDAATEERIAQILCEAQVAMQLKQNDAKGEAESMMVANIYQQELARLNQSEPDTSNSSHQTEKSMHRGIRPPCPSSISSGNSVIRGRKPQTDGKNLTQDLVARIYQEELMKLVTAAEASGNIDEVNVYKKELQRLSSSSSSSSLNNAMQLRFDHKTNDTERKDEDLDDFNISQIKSEEFSVDSRLMEGEMTSEVSSEFPEDLRVKKDGQAVTLIRHSGSAFTLVRPRSLSAARQDSRSPKYLPSQNSVNDEIVSPLEQMQSIANSLLTKSQRPLRAILPPITQEQINKYSNINTDDLVKKVKEMLSQYSISQRLFGENVLGLSQGSVSDLLARPKPWYMLTQKGREPFIRMQIFLEDEESITKLVATQFQIPPEKFLRSNSLFSESTTPGSQVDTSIPNGLTPLSPSLLSASVVVTSSSTNIFTGRNSNLSTGPSPLTGSSSDGHISHRLTNHSIDAFLDRPLIKSEPTIIRRSLELASTVAGMQSVPLDTGRDRGGDPLPPLGVQSAMAMILPAAFSFTPAYLHPSMLLGLQQFQHQMSADLLSSSPGSDVATMSQDLDTLEITTKVKEVLQFHNLGQKLFGEAVLGLSQGSVSELLSKPKPWHLLSLKGREPFVKMHLWLLDPLNIERLKMFQDQIKARKRKVITDDQLSDCQQQQPAHKKPRVFFTDEQKISLRQAYSNDPYPNQNTLDQLAKDLGVSTKTVINWFHNHRMRAKHQHGLIEMSSLANSSPDGSTSQVYSSRADGLDELSDDDDDIGSNVSEEEQYERCEESGSSQRPFNFTESQGQGGDVDSSLNQCLFPLFETVLSRNVSRSQSLLHHTHDHNRESCNSVQESATIGDCSNSSDGSSKLHSPTSSVAETETNVPETLDENRLIVANHSKERQCVNRRKSAKPQWVFEGTVLDRSSNHFASGSSSFHSNNSDQQQLSMKKIEQSETKRRLSSPEHNSSSSFEHNGRDVERVNNHCHSAGNDGGLCYGQS